MGEANMRIKKIPYTIFLLLLVAVSFLHADGLQTQLNEAYASYMEGMNADTVNEQQEAYNRSLKLYSQLEDQPGDGKLFYNMGNVYYELGEYGWAIYYYRMAQQRLPRNDAIRHQLTHALIKQGLPPPIEQPIVKNVLYWQYKLSQPERIQLFLALLGITFICASLYVWNHLESLKIALGLFATCSAIVLGSILYAQYFSPIEVVVVEGYGLYHSPSDESAVVSAEPLIPGTSLRVHDMVDNGSWLQVYLPTGQIGFLPSEAVRVVL